MTLTFNADLTARRKRRGLTEPEAARAVGLSIHEYCDLETYEYEWRDVLPTLMLRSVLGYFEMSWRDYIDNDGGESLPKAELLNRAISRQRKTLNLSHYDLSNKIGFDESVFMVAETHPLGIGLWPICVLFELAGALGINRVSFLSKLLDVEELSNV